MTAMHWDDLPSALEAALFSSVTPGGLRPMLIQAIAELRAVRAEKHSDAMEKAQKALLVELRGRDVEKHAPRSQAQI